MDKIAKLTQNERTELFRETATLYSMTPAVVEKDFWTCWVLGKLFAYKDIRGKILFKGGTSLSKVFGLIKRFSEDIDLILDWNEIADVSFEIARSKTQQDIFNKKIIEESRLYLKETFLPLVRDALEGVTEDTIETGAPDVINIRYPKAFDDTYLRPEIRLEIGALAAWLPNAEYYITSYAAEKFPQKFSLPKARVRVIKAERTFWEKATILHQEAHRSEDKVKPLRYSRHYYDLAQMACSDLHDEFIKSAALLPSVVAFKKKFYPCTWAEYDSAKIGTLQLVPQEHAKTWLEKDYEKMRSMIFGNVPEFSEIMRAISDLEAEINHIL